jgi:nitronate monooxygenase
MNGPAAERLSVQDMGSIWAGTGVGLVNTQENAADIVQEVRGDTRKYIERALSSL